MGAEPSGGYTTRGRAEAIFARLDQLERETEQRLQQLEEQVDRALALQLELTRRRIADELEIVRTFEVITGGGAWQMPRRRRSV